MGANGLLLSKDPTEILDELKASREKGNVVGVIMKGEDEMITTSVVDILSEGNETSVRFQPCDLHGDALPANPIRLSNIVGIIRFSTQFESPFYKQMRQQRK